MQNCALRMRRNARNVDSATDFKGNRQLAIPACITHVTNSTNKEKSLFPMPCSRILPWFGKCIHRSVMNRNIFRSVVGKWCIISYFIWGSWIFRIVGFGFLLSCTSLKLLYLNLLLSILCGFCRFWLLHILIPYNTIPYFRLPHFHVTNSALFST